MGGGKLRSRCMVDGKLLIQNWARFTVARRVWTSRAKYEDSILQEHTPVAKHFSYPARQAKAR